MAAHEMVMRVWSALAARPLRWIGLLALLLRLALLLLYPHYFDFTLSGQTHGIRTHDIYARNLLATGVYGYESAVADAELPPLYSFFLAALYATVGRGYWQLGLAQILLELVAIVALYDIARRLWPKDARVAALAALFHAAYPYLIFQSLTMVDTTLYLTGLYAWVWLLVRMKEVRGKKRAHWLVWLGGVILAALLLLRPNVATLLPFAVLWLAIGAGWRFALRQMALMALVSALLLLPWLSFGAGVYGRPVFIALHGGGNFLQGNHPCTATHLRAGYDTSWMNLDAHIPAEARGNLAEEDAALLRAGLDYWAQNPGAIPELLWLKFRAQWDVNIWPPQNPPADAEEFAALANLCAEAPGLAIDLVSADDPLRLYDEAPEANTFRTLHRWYFGPLLGLAVFGFLLSWRQWRRLSLLWFLQLSMTLVYITFHPATRYRAPTDPLLFVFSAIALCWLWERGQPHMRRWVRRLPSGLGATEINPSSRPSSSHG